MKREDFTSPATTATTTNGTVVAVLFPLLLRYTPSMELT